MSEKIFPNPCEHVKAAATFVMTHATEVQIDEAALSKFVSELKAKAITYQPWSESHFPPESTDFETLLRYIFVIDTLNFCFWPNSPFEYCDLAKNLHNTLVHNSDFFCIDSLCAMTPERLRENVFKADFCLLAERARMIREVFTVIKDNYAGKCAEFVKQCGKDAVRLVKMIVDSFCCFRDHAIYEGCQVFFYKRAQILVSDLHLAYADLRGKNRTAENSVLDFTAESICQLTMFADYRVPQILRSLGVLKYSEALSKMVDERRPIAHGSKCEVEIRAATVQSVEVIKNLLKKEGINVLSIEVDVHLWEEGEKAKEEMKPHHRTLSIFY